MVEMERFIEKTNKVEMERFIEKANKLGDRLQKQKVDILSQQQAIAIAADILVRLTALTKEIDDEPVSSYKLKYDDKNSCIYLEGFPQREVFILDTISGVETKVLSHKLLMQHLRKIFNSFVCFVVDDHDGTDEILISYMPCKQELISSNDRLVEITKLVNNFNDLFNEKYVEYEEMKESIRVADAILDAIDNDLGILDPPEDMSKGSFYLPIRYYYPGQYGPIDNDGFDNINIGNDITIRFDSNIISGTELLNKLEKIFSETDYIFSSGQMDGETNKKPIWRYRQLILLANCDL